MAVEAFVVLWLGLLALIYALQSRERRDGEASSHRLGVLITVLNVLLWMLLVAFALVVIDGGTGWMLVVLNLIGALVGGVLFYFLKMNGVARWVTIPVTIGFGAVYGAVFALLL